MLATQPMLEVKPLPDEWKPMIYLAGAIHHVPPEFAITWRRQATDALKDRFKILDPTANKDLYQPDVNTSVYTPEQIVTADLDMIFMADIILAEISRTDIPYHGTSIEIAIASNMGKLVLVWGGCRSYFIRYYASKMFDTMPDAISYLLYNI